VEAAAARFREATGHSPDRAGSDGDIRISGTVRPGDGE